MRFRPIEFEILGQAAPILAQPSQEFFHAGRLFNFQGVPADGMQRDIVTFAKTQCLDNRGSRMARLLPHFEICTA